MSFPTSPITGQVHSQDGKLWKFNGTAWEALKTPVYWFAVEGKPTTFPPSAHSHQLADTTGLQSALDGKQPAGSYAPAVHNHTDVQIFTASGTWTKPTGAKSVHVVAIAGGGGGSSGRIAAGTQGGGGGAGGVRAERIIPASLLGATEAVTVGLGGLGGVGPTAINAATVAGTKGGDTQFGTTPFVICIGGSGGGTSGAAGFQTNRGQWIGAGGGSGGTNAAGNSGGNAQEAPAGGGGGAGQDATPTTQYAGGLGGAVLSLAVTGGTVAGGTAGGGSGQNGSSYGMPIFPGGGGGGGGSNTTGNGGNGGNGGLYGGGGGGGGCCAFGYQAGSGGNGAQGVVVITTFF